MPVVLKEPETPKPKIVEAEEGNEPVNPKDTEKVEELKATMEPEQKKEFVKKMAEAIVKKEPIKYNFKYNPSGFITDTDIKSVNDKFGKQMKL